MALDWPPIFGGERAYIRIGEIPYQCELNGDCAALLEPIGKEITAAWETTFYNRGTCIPWLWKGERAADGRKILDVDVEATRRDAPR